MHLGTAVRTRTVGLFGPTTRHWGFFPSGKHDTVLESALPCRPCSLHGGRGCDRGVQCMRDITPDAVFHAVTAPQP
jgi:ADP-heptose:LPS heptosyltransferase